MAQKTIVGLDIGTTKLRGVEATMVGGNPKIIGISSVPLPDGTVVGGEIENVANFSEAVKALWKVGKFTAKDTRVVINSENNIAKLASMHDEVDFAKTLPFRLKSKLQFPSADYYISYHTLRKYESEERDTSRPEGFKVVPKRDIFLAAAKRTLVDSVLDGFKGTGVRLLSIDLAPLAMIRAENNPEYAPDHDDEIDIHVNVGGDTTTVVISNNSQPVFVRIIDIGGNNITDSVAEQLDVSFTEAEKLKLETLTMKPSLLQRPLHVGSVFEEEEDIEEDQIPEYSEDQLDAYEVVNDELGAIIENITDTIQYFVDQNHQSLGEHINTVYLSGGTASFRKIRHHLIHEIGAERTVISAPLDMMNKRNLLSDGLAGQFPRTQHEFVLAVGAALGVGGEKND